MSLLSKIKRTAPEGAHYRRSFDGGYGTIWLCSEGHGTPGKVDEPPTDYCMECRIERGPDPSVYRRATLDEAWRYIIKLEGFLGATSGVGFTMIGKPTD